MLKIPSLPVTVMEWRKLSPLFFLSAGALLGLVMVTWTLGQRAEQKNAALTDALGTAVVQLSARSLTDAAASQNLIGMHAILQQVAAQPRVQMAVVYDMDQRLLVQAGHRRQSASDISYSAPIPLHDNVVGHVSITLDGAFPGDGAVRWALTGTWVLLLALMALAFYEGYGHAWQMRARPQKTAEDDVPLDGNDAVPAVGNTEEVPDADDPTLESRAPDADASADEQGADAAQSTPALTHSDLILVLPNRQRLSQQLSRERFQALTEDFERQLHEVLALYGGRNLGSGPDEGFYCIRFTSSDGVSEAAFNALCSAHLIQALSRDRKVPLPILAEVCHPDSDVKITLSETGIFIQSALLNDRLSARLELASTSEVRSRLQGFRAPFAALLERQLEQLLTIA